MFAAKNAMLAGTAAKMATFVAATTNTTVPSYQVGDVIIAYHWYGGVTAPSLPSYGGAPQLNWQNYWTTDVGPPSRMNNMGAGIRVVYAVTTQTGHTMGSWDYNVTAVSVRGQKAGNPLNGTGIGYAGDYGGYAGNPQVWDWNNFVATPALLLVFTAGYGIRSNAPGTYTARAVTGPVAPDPTNGDFSALLEKKDGLAPASGVSPPDTYEHVYTLSSSYRWNAIALQVLAG